MPIICFRLLGFEPWREESHRQLMEWLAQSGQRRAALAQYKICVRMLADELAVEPGQVTRETYQRLLHDDRPTPAAQTPYLPPTQYPLVGRQRSGDHCARSGIRPAMAGPLCGDHRLIHFDGKRFLEPHAEIWQFAPLRIHCYNNRRPNHAIHSVTFCALSSLARRPFYRQRLYSTTALQQ